MLRKLKKSYMCPIMIGLILILIGLIIQIPGGALTTYKFMNGESAGGYAFDNKYSSIDEYVGGDAYNFIIGASLVGGKIAGTIAAKAVAMVGGAICICFGVTLRMLEQEKDAVKMVASENTESEVALDGTKVEINTPKEQDEDKSAEESPSKTEVVKNT